jgi:hypothetical protein
MLVAGLGLAACQPEAMRDTGAPQPAPGWAGASADDLVIVDCLLPGRVRQMGTRLTYMEPRRPLRTDRRDCEIRGGEFVAFDRADYGTALAIWMQEASEGNADAMTYVGEIHERGLGRPPDHAEAARWYRRAAEQGHRRARINLANLYAQGLGVPKDEQQALRLYAQASGMPPAELVLASAEPEPAPPPPPPQPQPQVAAPAQPDRSARDARRIQELQDQLAEARREQERLAARVETETAPAEDRERLLAERAELEQRLAEVEARRQALAERERGLDERLARLDEQRAALETAREALEAQARRDERPPEDLARERAELESRAAALAAQQAALDEERAAVGAEREQRLAELDAEIEARRAAFEQELAAARAEQTEAGATEQRRLEELQQQVQELERQLAEQARPVETAEAPVIHLLDPDVPDERLRGSPVIRVRGGISTRAVSGRVDSGAGLLSLTVNDATIEPDASGAFRTEVALAANGTPVRIVAVDRRGQRAERSFVLEREPVEEQVAETAAPTPVGDGIADIARAVDFGTYHALVIGNDDYRHLERLDMAVNDAEAVARVLRERYGFRVTLLRDATKRDIFQAFRQLRETLTENDNLLIYYAGHGIYEDIHDLQRGYWLPVNADHDDDFEWIPTDEVVAQVDAMSAKQVLIVADSCFSGAFMKTRSALARLRAGRSPEALIDWYNARAQLRTRAVMTSGGLEPVLDAGGGGHSVFARAFLDVLSENDGILEGAELYRDVAARVRYAAAGVSFGGRPFQQTPQYARLRFSGDGELADFFFVPRANGPGS